MGKKKLIVGVISIITLLGMLSAFIYAGSSNNYILQVVQNEVGTASDEGVQIKRNIISSSDKELNYELEVKNIMVRPPSELAIYMDTTGKINQNVVEKYKDFITMLYDLHPDMQVSLSDSTRIILPMQKIDLDKFLNAVNNFTVFNSSHPDYDPEEHPGDPHMNGTAATVGSFTNSEVSPNNRYCAVFMEHPDCYYNVEDEDGNVTKYGIYADIEYDLWFRYEHTEQKPPEEAQAQIIPIWEGSPDSEIIKGLDEITIAKKDIKITEIFTNEILQYFDFQFLENTANRKFKKNTDRV